MPSWSATSSAMPLASRSARSPPAKSPTPKRVTPRLLSAWPSKARAPTARAISIARSQAARVSSPGRAQHEDLGLGREHARQRGRRRVGRQHPHRVAVGGQRAVAVARDPQVAAEALARQRRGDHVVGAVGELDRHAPERDRTVVLAGDVGVVRRVGRRPPASSSSERSAASSTRSQISSARSKCWRGLGEGEDLLGLEPGAHVRRQRLGHAVRGAPVLARARPRPSRRPRLGSSRSASASARCSAVRSPGSRSA